MLRSVEQLLGSRAVQRHRGERRHDKVHQLVEGDALQVMRLRLDAPVLSQVDDRNTVQGFVSHLPAVVGLVRPVILNVPAR
jgi:glycosyltransferase A (GT-A) superfamily protein (DUF2064 family)